MCEKNSENRNYIEDLLNENVNPIEEQYRSYTIFQNINAFDDSYCPPIVQFRNSEILKLSKLVFPLINDHVGLNLRILVHGERGSGKTLSLKNLIPQLETSIRIRSLPMHVCFINCFMTTATGVSIEILKSVSNINLRRGYGWREILCNIAQYLKENHRHLLLILDEIDLIIARDPEFAYALLKNDAPISIVGITSDIDRLKKTKILDLFNQKIEFTSYSQYELTQIIRSRCSIALKRECFPQIITQEIIDDVIDTALRNKQNLRGILHTVYNYLIDSETQYSSSIAMKEINSKESMEAK